jgi:hypothetical protein
MPIDVRIGLLSIALGVCSGAALVSADDVAPKPGAAADSGTIPALKIRRSSLESLGVDPPELAREVDAGTIPRAALQAELSGGIGKFLRQVRLQPALAGGHFIGWRLLQIFEGRTDVHVSVLRPGDTVLRVNGRSVERPEEFKAIWDSLVNAPELVLDIQRGGKASKLKYSIVN